jgi:RNA polymerase sigma-70 factor (ECF subfamily)
MLDWPELVKQYGPLVWRAAYRLLGNEADAADCFQDTFLRAMKASQRETVRNWPGLLQRIAVQSALDRLKQRIRTRHRHSPETNLDGLGGSEPDPARSASESELQLQLRIALAELPESQATVFALSELHEMSYQAIAEVTGHEPSNVGVLLHRARRRLAEILSANSTCDRRCTNARRD